MTDRTVTENRDWFVPGILVAVVIVLAVIIGIVAGVRDQGSNEDSATEQLERWSSCLRSEGANVPLVEALGDGGFRVTVDGSLLSDGLVPESIVPALATCKDDVPEAFTKIMSAMNDLSWLSLDEFIKSAPELDEKLGVQFDRFMEDQRHVGRDLSDIAKRCKRIDKSRIHPQLLKSCRRSN